MSEPHERADRERKSDNARDRDGEGDEGVRGGDPARDEKLLKEMGEFNEKLVKAGVMLAGDGLRLASKRVRLSGSNRTVIDGPFAKRRNSSPAARSEQHGPVPFRSR